MKISSLNTQKRTETRKYAQYDILAYGEKNDYPQTVLDLLGGSTTGTCCLQNYRKFVFGRGFRDRDAWQMIVNKKADTLDSVLHQIVRDLCTFGGFALHLNFNRLYQITSIQPIAYENVRLCLPDSKKHPHSVALHPDWGKRNTHIKAFKTEDIEYLPLYDPLTIAEMIDACPNIADFTGAVLYYSNQGKGNYALPIFAPALVDMNSEEGLANVINRNVKNGFLPAGVFIDVRTQNTGINDDPDEAFFGDSGNANPEDAAGDATREALRSLTGDENSNKLLYVQVDSREEIPEFKPIEAKNYDKDFTVSRAACEASIGRAFNQPDALRAKGYSNGFSAEVLEQAFRYYNNVTEDERILIERVMTSLMTRFKGTNKGSYDIEKLSY